jgi:glycerophosphoryl diester phosphodiesterase
MDLDDIYRDKPIFFGHRGDRLNFPENTIASYRSAIKNGLKAIELDVMLTKDERLVCSHNFDLERETTGLGFIDEIDYIDLAKVKTGKQFSESKRQPIPLFTEVIKSLPKTVLLNIEIKTKRTFDLKVAVKVAQLIESGEIPQKVIVSSFNPFAVRIVKLISKSIPTVQFCRKRNMRINAWTVNNVYARDKLINKNIDGIITDNPALAEKTN